MPTTNAPDQLVHYVRNADRYSSTERLRFSDDRDDLEIGKAGYVTEEELSQAAMFGAILEATDEEELEKLGIEVPKKPEREIPLREMSLEELKALAKDEEADTTGAKSKDDYATAIEKARGLVQPEGQDSLPPTATTGPGVPTAQSQPAAGGSSTGAA
jgi:hypothetical protein